MLRLKSAITESPDAAGCSAARGGPMHPLVMTFEKLGQALWRVGEVGRRILAYQCGRTQMPFCPRRVNRRKRAQPKIGRPGGIRRTSTRRHPAGGGPIIGRIEVC
jgi:hypothetical protein